MNEEEKKAIENLKTEYEKLIKEDNILFPLYKSDAKRLINLIDKQNKVIDEMAKYMEDGRGIEEVCNKKDCYDDEYIKGHCQKCLKCIKQYFIRKVEEDDNSTSK